MSAIELCRTAALGGHVEGCLDCGHVRCAYNSCRNRHCPKCQALARAHWLAARRPSCCRCRTSMSSSRCRRRSPSSPSRTRRRSTPSCSGRGRDAAHVAADPSASAPRSASCGAPYLGPEPAPSSARALRRHGRRTVARGTRWVACRPGFFLPVRVLSRLFRRLFLDGLAPPSRPASCASRRARRPATAAFARRLRALRQVDWVVYAKPPFGGPAQVLAYLGRYTHRVAIANARLISVYGATIRMRGARQSR